jgi:ketosteroid isomerase-like protein
MTRLAVALAIGLSFATTSLPSQPRSVSAAIDADVWAPVSASVVNKDIAAMGRVYHPDAVLVSSSGTQTLRSTLVRWGQGMVDDKAKGIRATVEFRFSKRQDDAETAFETGVFKYTAIDKAGKATPSYRQLECLLVKHQGKWVIVMERQLDAVTETVWNALPH